MVLKLRGTVLIKAKSTMTFLSGIGQVNLVASVVIMHQALIWLYTWAIVRVTEHPKCVAEVDVTIQGVRG